MVTHIGLFLYIVYYICDNHKSINEPFLVDSKIIKQNKKTVSKSLTFLDEIVPFLGPSPQTLGVCLLNVSSLLYQGLQFAAEPVPVVDPPGGPLVVSWLPERVRGDRQQRLLVAVMRHGGATLTHRPSVYTNIILYVCIFCLKSLWEGIKNTTASRFDI